MEKGRGVSAHPAGNGDKKMRTRRRRQMHIARRSLQSALVPAEFTGGGFGNGRWSRSCNFLRWIVIPKSNFRKMTDLSGPPFTERAEPFPPPTRAARQTHGAGS